MGISVGVSWCNQVAFRAIQSFRDIEMNNIQWLLTGIGVVVVALVYLWGIRSRIKEEIGKRRRRPGREPVVFGDSLPQPDSLLNEYDFGELGRITPDHHLADKVLVDVEIRPVEPRSVDRGIKAEADSAPAEAEVELPVGTHREADATTALSMTVILTVMAPHGQPFDGPRIQAVAEELDLRLNADGVFERFPERETASKTPIFGIAHLRKPGAFDSRTLQDLSTPGLLLFMNLPGPLEGTEALDLLVISADHLARNLGGTICDERHNRLTNPMLLQLRDRVADLERRWLAQLS